MGLGWALVAFFLPGTPQLLHLDLGKTIMIWIVPGAVGFFAPGMIGAGIITLAVGLLIQLYNLQTAYNY